MTNLDEKFAALGADHALGQEIRQDAGKVSFSTFRRIAQRLSMQRNES